MKTKEPDYLPHCRVLWIAEIIEKETPVTWAHALRLSQRIIDEMFSQSPELFLSQK